MEFLFIAAVTLAVFAAGYVVSTAHHVDKYKEWKREAWLQWCYRLKADELERNTYDSEVTYDG